ncbi:MAG: hypothetical protein H7Y08_06280 [Rhizobiaceae bacterium]|nr:hypothetical protein [Rhizobiaceae bacterium]
MTGWRMDLTVLTDLSASFFAACFMILLIFIGLAQQEEAAGNDLSFPIEADQAFHLVRRAPQTAGGMVELLYRHGHATPGIATSAGVDVFADRLEITFPDRGETRVLSGATLGADLLAAIGGNGTAEPLRLYVFDNRLYGETSRALQGAGQPFVEMSIPRALRDRQRPGLAWSQDFTALELARTGRPAFREGLAVLLAGSADTPTETAGAPTVPADGLASRMAGRGDANAMPSSSLLARLTAWGSAFAEILFPLAGLAAVAFVRSRHPPVARLATLGDDRPSRGEGRPGQSGVDSPGSR